MFLKVNIAQVQYGREDSKDGRLVLGGEVKDFHGREQTSEIVCIALSSYQIVPSLYSETEFKPKSELNEMICEEDTVSLTVLYLVEVIVGFSILQVESLFLLRRKTCQHLVEDVIVPLIFGLKQTSTDHSTDR